MPTVEGFTPQVFWTTIYGVIALCILFMIVYKVYQAICEITDRRRKKKEAEKPNFAEEVSQKVIDKLEPRFKEIEKNLSTDKARLDSHERDLATLKTEHDEIHRGLRAIGKFMLVIGNYGRFGESEEIKDASVELQKFLAEKL